MQRDIYVYTFGKFYWDQHSQDEDQWEYAECCDIAQCVAAVLQLCCSCVAVCCSVWHSRDEDQSECTDSCGKCAVSCRVLKSVAECCRMLQNVAECCSVLQLCCSVLQHVALTGRGCVHVHIRHFLLRPTFAQVHFTQAKRCVGLFIHT